MLKIKELKLSGIGRFVEEQTINMESLGSLVQIDGENLNTNGSSGSGKSTIFNALDYLLGLNDLPSTVLQSRLTKDPISVTGMFDWDGRSLTINRNKKGLKIEIDGVPTEGSSSITEAKLTEILGMPNHLFRKMLHKRQKEGGFFLDFTPKQMYEFLTDCLSLTDLRKKTTVVEDKIKDLESRYQIANNSWESNKSGLRATQDAVLSIGLAPVKDIDQSVILDLKNKHELATKNLNKTQEIHSNETKELETSRPQNQQAPIYDRSTQNSLEKSIKELEERSSRINNSEHERKLKVSSTIAEKSAIKTKLTYAINEGNSAKISATEIAQQVKKIRDSLCPTCDQTWITAAAKAKEDEYLTKLSLHKEKIVSAAAAMEQLPLIETELIDLQSKLAPILDPELAEIKIKQNEISILINEEKKKADEFYVYHNNLGQALLREFATKVTELRNRQLVELEATRGQAELDRRALEIAVNKLKTYEQARQRYDSVLSSIKAKEEIYKKEIDVMHALIGDICKELEKAEELKKILKSYASVSFDEALESIGDVATRIIRCIPNMSNATIQFEGQKETKEGKIKEEVNAVISSDGEIGIPIKSLSGGERSAVDLAVDLAVIDYLESKTGKGIDVFILDEPFTGLDTVSIENALEVLKNANINKKLIVVDHNPMIKEIISDRILVIREGTTSIIKQN